MSWESAAQDTTEKTAEGFHLYRATRFIRAKKDGTELKTAGGDPKLLVVYEDEAGGEGVVTYTLTEKAQWKLARDLARLGIDVADLDKRGVGMDDFANVDFVETELGGAKSFGYASMNGSYMNIDLCRRDEVPADIRDMLEGADKQKADDDNLIF